MSARDFGGEAHAPAPDDLVRAPLAQGDDYTPIPARAAVAQWNYEQAVDVTDTRWVAVGGQRRGGEQRARVLRAGRAA